MLIDFIPQLLLKYAKKITISWLNVYKFIIWLIIPLFLVLSMWILRLRESLLMIKLKSKEEMMLIRWILTNPARIQLTFQNHKSENTLKTLSHKDKLYIASINQQWNTIITNVYTFTNFYSLLLIFLFGNLFRIVVDFIVFYASSFFLFWEKVEINHSPLNQK